MEKTMLYVVVVLLLLWGWVVEERVHRLRQNNLHLVHEITRLDNRIGSLKSDLVSHKLHGHTADD